MLRADGILLREHPCSAQTGMAASASMTCIMVLSLEDLEMGVIRFRRDSGSHSEAYWPILHSRRYASNACVESRMLSPRNDVTFQR